MGMAAGMVAVGGASAAATEKFAIEESPVSAESVGSNRPAGHQSTVLWSVDTAERKVALTFDDGPLPEWTPLALDVLDEAKIRATFFVVGSRLATHANLVRKRYDRHEIGNHSWHHDDLSKLNYKDVMRSVGQTHDTIKRITGRNATLLRPPWGKMGGTTVRVAGELGYDLILWSLLVRDRALHSHPDELVEDVVGGVRPGMIMLAHDVGRTTRLAALQQLPRMIRGLKDRGFTFVTVSELRQSLPRQSGT
ncbi:polysaccharide deacetylase family protein [Actinocorallia longicatena]|uniref:Polysaccharide deacetylase family protein n=1 Tax=Actinocorallia longicatena TaxID=111803 RepID=A0ABP6Q8Z7_9ACTN